MRERLVRWLYARTGRGHAYWIIMACAQGGASVAVACATVALDATFFQPPARQLWLTLAVEAAFTLVAVALLAAEVRPRLAEFRRWYRTPDPSDAETARVWSLVVNGTAEIYRRWAWRTITLSVLPLITMSALYWHIGWSGVLAELIAGAVPAYYATAISYSISELLTRPMTEEITRREPRAQVYQQGTSLVGRLRIAVPAYTTAAATLTVGLVGFAHGPGALVVTTATAMAVGFALSIELTALLSYAVSAPIRRLQDQLEAVRYGNYEARVAVLSSDEFGQLAHDLNIMTEGLAEREAIRDTFGTYIDRSVGELILAGQVPPDGFEVVASIMFCDIRGFTAWAAARTAANVVSTLNDLFSTIVPIINAHGGHVDKFMGDGLLAFFGTPDPLPDHADRALEAAVAITRGVNSGASGLRMACGINTGPVVAGPIGGAGRLNFSVIGAAVNIAARVEAATRVTGDDVLITDATRASLARGQDLISRGSFDLKGASDPVTLFAATN